MDKIDFTFMDREVPESQPFEFTDPRLPSPMVVHLQWLDDLELGKAAENADAFMRRYVYGNWVNPATGGLEKEPDTYPHINGRPVTLTWERVHTMAKIELMQQAAPAGQKYSIDELINCALKAKHAWRALDEKATEIQRSSSPGKA